MKLQVTDVMSLLYGLIINLIMTLPHLWMIESLRLAKVPNLMNNAVESLAKT